MKTKVSVFSAEELKDIRNLMHGNVLVYLVFYFFSTKGDLYIHIFKIRVSSFPTF